MVMTLLGHVRTHGQPVHVTAAGHQLEGDLTVPADARGIVVFAHGSGSSRFSPRNQYVASVLHEAPLATLLLDLLTPDEDAIDTRTGHLRFDTDMLAERLVAVMDWIEPLPAMAALPLGLFGASTGAAAALLAAASRAETVRAVVSRGGRPDLAKLALDHVRAPTLLIVGGNDLDVLQLNQRAMAQLHTEVKLVVIPGASHLFEEPGALEEVAQLASDWFIKYLERT